MTNDKSSILKIILAVVILGAAGLATYFIMPKKTPPITVTPTLSSALTPEPTASLVPTPVVTPAPTVNISDWKTYRNESDGFEIKYPNNPEWIAQADQIKNPEAIKPVKSIINFNPKDKVYYSEGGKISPITVTVINGSLENYYKVYAKPTNTIEEKVLINNLSFIRDTDKIWGNISYKIEYPKKNLSFIISSSINTLGIGNSKEKLLLEDTFNQMLFTFKFIN